MTLYENACDGMTFFDAIMRGELDAVRAHVAAGAWIDSSFHSSSGMTLLMTALANGEGEIARYLVENGADVLASDYNGQTALHHTLHNPSDILALLIQKGSDMQAADASGETPLLTAIGLCFEDSVRILQACGADINGVPGSRSIPLHHAVALSSIDCLSFLISAGAKIDMPDDKGDTPLMRAVKANYSLQRINMLQSLLRGGADLLHRNLQGKNVFDIATEKDDRKGLALLEDARTMRHDSMLRYIHQGSAAGIAIVKAPRLKSHKGRP